MTTRLSNIISFVVGLVFRAAFALPAAGHTLTQMSATAMRETFQDRNLREDITLDDIWNRMKRVVDAKNNEIEIGDTPFIQVPTVPKGTHAITMGMTGPLQKAFHEGNAETMLGNGEQVTLYHLTLRYNEIKKSVAHRGWGIDYNDVEATGVYKTIDSKFAKAWQEYRGLRIRTASMLTYENALTKAPVSVKQQFNPNIFIPNLPVGNMPTWDVTDLTATAGSVDALGFYPDKTFSGADTYIQSIGARMMEAAGVSGSPLAYLDVDSLEELHLYLTTRLKMPKLRIGSEEGYLVVLPSEVISYLFNPNRTNSLGHLMKDMMNITPEAKMVPGMRAKYKSLWILEDERGPTVTLGGSAGSYTLKPGFMMLGNNDDRNLLPYSVASGSVNLVWDVGFVYGADALAEWIVNTERYAKESTEFGQLLEKGSYACGGIQLVRYDKDTPDDENNSASTDAGKTLVHRNSCMILMSRIPTTTLRT